MKVIDGQFGKEEEEESTTLMEVCAYVLEYMDLMEVESSEDCNITLIIDTPSGFTVTASKPEWNYILSTLSKATHVISGAAMGDRE